MATLTTELEAVNVMLATIGEAPINSLESASGVADAVLARSILKEASLSVQSEGWHFNTEKNFKLSPTVSGELILPENCLEADTVEASRDENLTVRGTKLYDITNQSYNIGKAVYVDMVLYLEFNTLPQAARHYITVKASRMFEQRLVGSQVLHLYSIEDEIRARAALLRQEARTGDHNILTGNWSVARILRR